jgi:hypothetical protein
MYRRVQYFLGFKTLSGPIKLLSTSRPEADESLFSFIIRLTEQNGYETPSWLLNSSGLNDQQLSQTGALIFKSYKNLKTLARVASVNLSELKSLTYPRVSSSFSTPLYSFFGVPLPKSVIRGGFPQVCPKCLLESGYCRRIWDLILVTTCPIHQCMLINVCPNCGDLITWLRVRISVCRCGFDWKFTCQPIKELELKVTRRIYQLCGLIKSKSDDIPLKHYNPLLELNLPGLAQVMFLIGTWHASIKVRERARLKRELNSKLHNLFSKAFSIFENWPHNFYRFLDLYQGDGKSIFTLQRELRSGLHRGTKGTYETFYKEFSASQFDFLREAINSYITVPRFC